MMMHRLKLNTDYYDDSASGIKTFEIRKNDRDYKVGDILELREWIWSCFEGKGACTGNVHWKIITYIFEDVKYLPSGYVCLSVVPIAEPRGIE
jgi:ParB family transcriptional regulator, chromosome partitioning protein